MRKFLVSAAIAASTFVAAAPAAAQWYPPQGNAYGYNNYGQVRRLDARIDAMQRQAGRLRAESRGLEHRLHRAARYGLNGREAFDIERGIQRLEVRIQREARDGNRYGGYYGQTGWSDHDRDGLNDRYEHDRGTNYDEDHDRD
jgi:opacity protein-like surface antigen